MLANLGVFCLYITTLKILEDQLNILLSPNVTSYSLASEYENDTLFLESVQNAFDVIADILL